MNIAKILVQDPQRSIYINVDAITWADDEILPGSVMFHAGGEKFEFLGTIAEFKAAIGI